MKRKASEVVNTWVLRYYDSKPNAKQKYHFAHNSNNVLYLCGCTYELALLDQLGIRCGYRSRKHSHKRNDYTYLELT